MDRRSRTLVSLHEINPPVTGSRHARSVGGTCAQKAVLDLPALPVLRHEGLPCLIIIEDPYLCDTALWLVNKFHHCFLLSFIDGWCHGLRSRLYGCHGCIIGRLPVITKEGGSIRGGCLRLTSIHLPRTKHQPVDRHVRHAFVDRLYHAETWLGTSVEDATERSLRYACVLSEHFLCHMIAFHQLSDPIFHFHRFIFFKSMGCLCHEVLPRPTDGIRRPIL